MIARGASEDFLWTPGPLSSCGVRSPPPCAIGVALPPPGVPSTPFEEGLFEGRHIWRLLPQRAEDPSFGVLNEAFR